MVSGRSKLPHVVREPPIPDVVGCGGGSNHTGQGSVFSTPLYSDGLVIDVYSL